MIKYQLTHARFDQISDHKHDILVWNAMSQLAHAAYKNTKFMFRKTG